MDKFALWFFVFAIAYLLYLVDENRTSRRREYYCCEEVESGVSMRPMRHMEYMSLQESMGELFEQLYWCEIKEYSIAEVELMYGNR